MSKRNISYRISGQVIGRKSRQGVAGLRVDAWDKDLIFTDLVGSAFTNEQGSFRMEFDASYFRELFLDRRPDLFFKVFREATLIKSTEDSVMWNVKAGETEIVIEVDVPVEKPKSFIVQGQIRQSNGSLLAGGIVKAFDKDLRIEERLGEAITDSAGRYDITYTADQFNRAEKKSADLVVRVYDHKRMVLAESQIIFNARPVETVDILIGGGVYKGPSEYEQLISDLTPLLQDLSFSELAEDDEHQDITFLSGETGPVNDN